MLCWGRQSGKSTWALNDLAKSAWEKPDQVIWFISPTFAQAKQQYRRFAGMLWPCAEIMTKKNQTELRIRFLNGSQVFFKSGAVLDDLRGETLHKVYIDEVREQHPDLWVRIIMPMLGTTNGEARFLSTPNGFDHFYDLYCKTEGEMSGTWQGIQVPSSASPYWNRELLEQMRSEMTEEEYAQEMLAQFRDLTSGRAYFSYGTHNHRDFSPFSQKPVEYVPFLPILIGMDFNLNPMAWALGQHHQDRIHWSEELYLKNSNTPSAADHLIDRLKQISVETGLNLGKIGVKIIGDATGKANQRTSNKSDYDVVCMALDKAGIRWSNQTPESNPGVKDRVTTTNARLKSASGEVFVTFNTKKMPNTHMDLQRTVWKNGQNVELDEGPKRERTHASDAISYPVMVLLGLKSTRGAGGVRIISRT